MAIDVSSAFGILGDGRVAAATVGIVVLSLITLIGVSKWLRRPVAPHDYSAYGSEAEAYAAGYEDAAEHVEEFTTEFNEEAYQQGWDDRKAEVSEYYYSESVGRVLLQVRELILVRFEGCMVRFLGNKADKS